MAIIDIQNVSKTFEAGDSSGELRVLRDIRLSIEENEFICILGPSGCGKSTLLRIISGLEKATGGNVTYRGERVAAPRKEIGVVFQNYSLMPWLNVEDNIALGLRFKHASESEIQKTVSDYLQMIGMEQFRRSMPHELSGGMQQRVAIARTLANDPDVVLMDEPFGALDAYTRIVLQKELLNIWEKHKKTILFVTHSVDEAIYLADRIILMSRDCGKILREDRVNLPRLRDRSDPEYARLTKELLEELERVNSTPR